MAEPEREEIRRKAGETPLMGESTRLFGKAEGISLCLDIARATRLAGDTGNNSARLIAESERQADAILALLDTQPTVAEVRAQVLREAADEMERGFNSATLNAERRAIKRWLRARADREAEVRADEALMSTETPALPTGDLVRGWDHGYAAAVADAANGTRTLNPYRSALLDEMARIPAQSETDAFPRCPHEECEAGYHHWHYKSDGMPSSRADLDLHILRDEFEHQETDDVTRCYGPRVVR